MDFVALDLETANTDLSSICQIGIATFRDGQVVAEYSTLIDPEDYFDPMNIHIHGIMEEHVRGAPTYTQICDQINGILAGSICATHTHFDRSAIQQCCTKYDLPLPECNWLDTARVARRTWDAVAHKGYGLANLASMLGIEFKHHDALEDARAAGLVLCAAVNESGLDPHAWLKRVKRRIGGSHSSTDSYTAPTRYEGAPDGPLFGEVIVFTGALTIPRSQAAKMAANLGCGVTSGVSKKISLLVVGDQDVTKLAGHRRSSKHRKAIDLINKGCEIRILRETDFLAMIDDIGILEDPDFLTALNSD